MASRADDILEFIRKLALANHYMPPPQAARSLGDRGRQQTSQDLGHICAISLLNLAQ